MSLGCPLYYFYIVCVPTTDRLQQVEHCVLIVRSIFSFYLLLFFNFHLMSTLDLSSCYMSYLVITTYYSPNFICMQVDKKENGGNDLSYGDAI